LQMPGVSQAVEIDKFGNFRAPDDLMDQIRADKSRAACDEQVHKLTTKKQRNEI
jgi:hypothetical protein